MFGRKLNIYIFLNTEKVEKPSELTFRRLFCICKNISIMLESELTEFYN